MNTTLRATLALLFAALVVGCQTTSSPPRTTDDRTTPAGNSRGVSPKNDMTESGAPTSEAAHQSR